LKCRKDSGFDEYVSDPARPVPFIESFDNEVPREYMTADQRFAAKRPDVLVYETEPLEEDVTVAGEVSPAPMGFVFRNRFGFRCELIDVYPVNFPDSAAESERAAHGRLRATRARRTVSPQNTATALRNREALTPNQPTALNFSLPSVNHTFRRGHRNHGANREGTWFPLTDRNPRSSWIFRRRPKRIFRRRRSAFIAEGRKLRAWCCRF